MTQAATTPDHLSRRPTRRASLRAMAAALLLLACAPPLHAADAPRVIVYFANWSAALDDTANAVIKHAAEQIAASKARHIDVLAFADSDGSQLANHYLTQARGQVVIDALAADGVDVHRLRLKPHGRQDEAGVGSRRVEIVIPAK